MVKSICFCKYFTVEASLRTAQPFGGKPVKRSPMNLLAEYHEKKKNISDLLAMLQDNDYVFSAQAMSEPVTILQQLPQVFEHGVNHLTFNSIMPMEDYSWFHDTSLKDKLEHVCWFYTAPVRQAAREGLVSFLPGNSTGLVHKTLERVRAEGRRSVLLATASPMDEDGYFTLSVSALFERDLLDGCAMVLLEVSSGYPRTCGDTRIHISQVDGFVETERLCPEVLSTPYNEVDKIIGHNVAELIPDGSTLQLGVGHIPNAVAKELEVRHHLGIHSGLFSDEMMQLMECGAVDNSQKGVNAGKAICAFASGSRVLYDFVRDNPLVEFHRGTFANSPIEIGRNNHMVSLNTALEIDLTGQIAAESMGMTQWSATGAQQETIRGAQLSQGGKSIIALHSSYYGRNEAGEKVQQSKIVPFFKPGTIVTTSRNDVDYIVTEYGVAWLRGASIRQRVKELIAIAHPLFRGELKAEAKEYGLL